jgi:hypothetical protein
VLILFFAGTLYGGYWEGLDLRLPLWERLSAYPAVQTLILLLLAAAAVYLHFSIRRWTAGRVARSLVAGDINGEMQAAYLQAFRKNSRWFRSIFRRRPAGWGGRTARSLAQVLDDSQGYVQKLNDMYTNPSGQAQAGPPRADTPP